jgi:hypothetical protein
MIEDMMAPTLKNQRQNGKPCSCTKQLEEYYTMKQLVNPLNKELLLPYENPKSYLQASENLEALQERVLDYQKLAEASIHQVQPTTCHKQNTRPQQT